MACLYLTFACYAIDQERVFCQGRMFGEIFLLFLLIEAACAQAAVDSCESLQALAGNLSGSFIQTHHISCAGSEAWNGGAGFRPIGTLATPFSGEYDGSGYEISYLTSNRTDENYVGLFGYLATTGLIKGVSLKHVRIVGKEEVGALVGRNAGTVANSTVLGVVTGTVYTGGAVGYNLGTLTALYSEGSVKSRGLGQGIGGLVGRNQGTVTEGVAFGTVAGSSLVGGVVGYNSAALISIRAQSNLTGIGLSHSIGGLLGYNSALGTVTNGEVFAVVTGSLYVGGAVGNNYGAVTALYAHTKVIGVELVGGLLGSNPGTVTNSTVFTTTTGTTLVGGVLGLNHGTLAGIYAEVDVTGAHSGRCIGGLVGQSTGLVMESTVLGAVRGAYLVGGAVGINFGALMTVDAQINVTGVYPGQAIGGLVGSNDYYSTVTDSISSGIVRGHAFVGGAVGHNGGTLTALHVQSDVIGADPGESIGGLVGQSKIIGVITNSTAAGTVTGSYRVGGLVGHLEGLLNTSQSWAAVIGYDSATGGLIGESSGDVYHSTAYGPVTGIRIVGGAIGNNLGRAEALAVYSEVEGNVAVGGLAGQNLGIFLRCWVNNTVTARGDRAASLVGDNRAEGHVIESVAFGRLLSEGDDVGALAGLNAGIIDRSYATSRVTGRDNVGLVGRQTAGGVLTHCYGTGAIEGTGRQVGGVIGENDGMVEYCYSLGPVTGKDEAGGLVGHSVGANDHVRFSYTAGCVQSNQAKGGLVGSRADGIFEASYWDINATGQDFPAGESGSFGLRAYGKKTPAMYHWETFQDWDPTIWCIAHGKSYPYHCDLVPDKAPTVPEGPCPGDTTFYEKWMPRWILTVTLMATGLWLETVLHRWRASRRLKRLLESPDRLAWMAEIGNLAAVRWLYTQDASMATRKVKGDTAIEWAAKGGHYDVVQFLCEENRLGEQKAALCRAAYAISQQRYPQIAAYLKPHLGVDVSAEPTAKLVCSKRLQSFVRLTEGQVGLFESWWFFPDPPQLNQVTPEGCIALLSAGTRNRSSEVIALVRKGDNPFICTRKGKRLIQLLIEKNGWMLVYHFMQAADSKSNRWRLSFEILLQLLVQQGRNGPSEVDVSGLGLDDVAFERLLRALQATPVTHLKASHNKITGLGIRCLFEQLGTFPTLQHLDIRYNRVDKRALGSLKAAVRQHSSVLADVLLEGNELLSPDEQDWSRLTVPTLTWKHRWLTQMFYCLPVAWLLLLQRYQVMATWGFFWWIADKVLDGSLIIAMDEDHQNDLVLVSLVFFLLASLGIGLLSLKLMYGTWLPRRAGDLPYWLLFMPVLGPDLVRLRTRTEYADTQLVLLKLLCVAVEDLPQFTIGATYLARQGLSAIVLARLLFSLLSTLAMLIRLLYNLPALHKGWRDLRGMWAFAWR